SAGPLTGGREEHGGRGMVAEILPDPWQIMQHWHTDTLELGCRANTGAQEQMWRANGATTQHNLVALNREALPTALDFDPYRSVAVKQETTGHDIALDGQVQAMARWVEIRQGHADAHPIQGIARSG